MLKLRLEKGVLVDGLLLRLFEDKDAGRTFWRCFGGVRGIFNRHYWILPCQPWMGAPVGFDASVECGPFEGGGRTSVGLWRPGALGRWAEKFCEESVVLWAVNPEEDAAAVAARYARLHLNDDRYIEENALIWLEYGDETCWEILSQDEQVLEAVRRTAAGVKVYPTDSRNRDNAYRNAGLFRNS